MDHDHHSHHSMEAMDMSHDTTTMDPHHGHEHGHGDGPMTGMGGHDMMSMYFHTNIGNDYVLFNNWKPNSAGEMVWTCFVIFLLAVLYEGLKYYREYLMKSWKVTTYYVSDTPNGIRTNGTAIGIPGRENKTEIYRKMFSCPHFFQTGLHVLQFFISYLLMLVFMTYNVYFCVAVLIGAGVGYFLFGWYKSTAVDITEHCH